MAPHRARGQEGQPQVRTSKGTTVRPTSRPCECGGDGRSASHGHATSRKSGRGRATPRRLNVRQQFPLMEWAQAMLADMPKAESSDSRPATAPAGGPLPALRPSSVASTISGTASTSQSARPSSIASSRSGTVSGIQSARSTAAGVTKAGFRGTPTEPGLDVEELPDSVHAKQQHEQEVPVRKAAIAWGLESVEMLESPASEAAAADPVGSNGLDDSGPALCTVSLPRRAQKGPEAGTEKKVEAKRGTRSSRNGTSSKTVRRPRSTPLRRQNARHEEVNRPVSVTGSLRSESRCGPKLRPSLCKGLKAVQLRSVHGTTMPKGTKVRKGNERAEPLL